MQSPAADRRMDTQSRNDRPSALPAGVLPALVLGLLAASAGALEPARLRCEYLENPLAIETAQPRLSWIVTATQRGARQSAYQVIVSRTPEALVAGSGELWDSGRVVSSETAHIIYLGSTLASRQVCWWAVRVWDEAGQMSAWSPPARWRMGLLAKTDWQAQWIADPVSVDQVPPRGPVNGYHSTFAPSADTPQWVTIDLGQARPFDAVRLCPARPYDWQPDTPGFMFPLRFKLEAAAREDFADARLLLDRTAADEPNPATDQPLYRVPTCTARYIRLTVTRLRERDPGQFAFALAEMQILNGDTDLAQGARVLALNSVETGTWAKANLTDGLRQTLTPDQTGRALPGTFFRKAFALDQPIKQATAYATALGVYELRVNGRRVGDDLLAPEWTNYRRLIQYQTYDVTALLHAGENAMAAVVGEGWYAGALDHTGRYGYGTHPRFLLQLEIEFADGRTQTLVSDASWRCTNDGPIHSVGIYDGERYDARRETPGWDAPGGDVAAWRPARAFDRDSRQLIAQQNEPIRVEMELQPVKLTEPQLGVFVYDLGQNMVGRCRVRALGAAGRTVTLRHAEMLNDDGTIYTANLGIARQTDTYTPRADGPFEFVPRLTYHGFRFVELTGTPERPPLDAIVGQVFHSSAPRAGRFECSDASLNRLMENILWTQRANLMSTPTDCPQRAERLGWMGDAQAFAQTAIFNMDLAAFFAKYARDMRNDQADDGRFPDFAPHAGYPVADWCGAPAWGDAGTIVPWRAYQNYADTRILADQFAAACRWVDYVQRNNPDLVWSQGRNNDYGDWLNGDSLVQAGWPQHGGAIPKEVFATAFFAHSTQLVAKMADVLGRAADARHYGELHAQIKAAFNRRFVQSDGRITGDTQAGYALALNFDLLPEDLRPQAVQYLLEGLARYQNRLSTGIHTSHRAMLELTRSGHANVAWRLLTNRSFPSWLYMLDNGATTIWERWDGYVKGRGFQNPGMNSFNHWALGAVGEWMWRCIVGFNPDEACPGWKHFTIAPRPGGGVTWAQGEYQSIRGRIACAWRIEGDQLTLRVTVPANTTATIRVPTTDAAKITESGQPVTPADQSSDQATFEVSSGSYEFVAPFRAPATK